MTEQRKRIQELNALIALRQDYRNELQEELNQIEGDLKRFYDELKQLSTGE